MGIRSLTAALTLALLAGSTSTFASMGDEAPHEATPAQATAAASTQPTKPAASKRTPTLSNTKVAPARTPTQITPKATTKQPAKPPTDDHSTGHDEGTAEAPPAPSAPGNRNPSSEVAPDAAATLSLLTEGNARWVSNMPQAPNTDAARREEVAAGQHPMVTILTCADSRIPVERVFDRGVGDVFVIRVAGNVAGGSETGTIEYGVEHLKTPLLVVMGHTKCGAVAAAATNAPVHGFVAKLVSNIQPAVERARRANPDADEKTLSALAVNENVWQSVFDLFKSSQPIRELAASGQLKVVGAIYDITTGKVEFLGEHPWQNELLTSLGSKLATPPTAIATHTPKAEANPVIQPQAAKPESKPASTANAEHDGNTIDSSGH